MKTLSETYRTVSYFFDCYLCVPSIAVENSIAMFRTEEQPTTKKELAFELNELINCIASRKLTPQMVRENLFGSLEYGIVESELADPSQFLRKCLVCLDNQLDLTKQLTTNESKVRKALPKVDKNTDDLVVLRIGIVTGLILFGMMVFFGTRGNNYTYVPSSSSESTTQATKSSSTTAVSSLSEPTFQNIKSSSSTAVSEVRGSIAGKLAGELRAANSVGIEMRWIPAGSFMMGNKVKVELTQGFWMGKTEITQGQWDSVMGPEASQRDRTGCKQGVNQPASSISWDSADAYAKALTLKERKLGILPTDWEYVLPTEAQWEYACRSGTTTVYSFGDTAEDRYRYAWNKDSLYYRTAL